ncbi:hypothetical protein M8J77_015531 [Diaphorina citri]|nr:hypothetical protein M8J77_015531 [Diaphorina citri]
MQVDHYLQYNVEVLTFSVDGPGPERERALPLPLLVKQEVSVDEACSMQKVPSLSDLSDPESSLGSVRAKIIHVIRPVLSNKSDLLLSNLTQVISSTYMF